ncbi:uncharacterized protein DS421_2g47030 [Arachis hypogaea]|nr:uncharacterized protein DS421_2g47030 [Arachis hypogaea]
MEKNSVSPFSKEKDVLKFSEDTPTSQSELEREGRTDASENGTTQDQHVLRLLGSIREHLDKDEETMKALLQSHGDQIKKPTEVVEGHSHILGALIKNVSTKEDLVPAKKNEGKNAPAKERRGRPRKTSDATKKTGMGCYISLLRTLRKLYFEEEESSTDVMLEVQQQGHRTPFTYYTHSNAYIDGAETPKCMEILFPLPEGMELVGMELAVATYVFGKDLPKSEVLIPTEHGLGQACPAHPLSWQTDDGRRDQSGCCHVHRRHYVRFCSQEVVASHHFPEFQQIAINPTNYCPSMLEYIKRKFMGKADQLVKLVYLDSLKDFKLTKSHKDQMLYVEFFLENLLCDDVFYEGTPNEMHKPSTCEIVEPEIGQ